ncbi:MAG TPA: hypothetical protein VJB90_03265 [Candidatus Nanoarchaeia archaeon]|nr:hypothetical protein [Candidatus Nanoarchaeia archaeon]
MTLEEQIREAVAEGKTVGKPHIFRVGSKYVAKQFHEPFLASHDLRYANAAVRLGVRVPEPLGVYQVGKFHYFVMDFIDGVYRDDLSGEDWVNAFNQLEEAIFKLLRAGIDPNDSEWSQNSLYIVSEGQLYLIDYGHWQSAEHWAWNLWANYFRSVRSHMANPEMIEN